jgi:DNA polymerase-3 subunit delta
MAVLDLRALQQDIHKNGTRSIYLLLGTEAFLVDEAINTIKSETLKSGAIDFNYDCFYATDVEASVVRDIIGTLPMMCPKRLVLFKSIHLLKEKDWEALYSILDNPVESTVLLLVGEKLDKRKKAFKKINQKGAVVELKKPYDNKMPTWIKYIAQRNNLKMSQDAIFLLHQLVGSNLNEVQNEILKLRQYSKDGEQITEVEVAKVVSRSRVDSVFEFTEALGHKDMVKALCCLANLLEHGQSEVGALALVNRHLKILSSVLEGQKSGLSQQKLSEKVGVPSFFMKQYLSQSYQWNTVKINQTITTLYETDKALKSSPVSSHIWLENFVLSVCS